MGFLLTLIVTQTGILDSAHTKEVIATAADLVEATRNFKERYKVLPGDHPAATAQIPGVLVDGDGNGLIDGAEPNIVMSHLFFAGITKGGANVLQGSYGRVWVMSYGLATSLVTPCLNAAQVPTPVNGGGPTPKALNVIVFQGLPTGIAFDIDNKFDDGVFNTGSIRASSAYSGLGVPDHVACFAMPLF
jgi:hypothetical protein